VKVELKELSAIEREMEFELEWKDIEKDYAKFAKKFAKDITLPGFRKGMAPVSLLEKKFGGQIEYDFINEMFGEYYGKALDEKKINPVSQADLLDLDFKKGSALKMKVKFEVMPEWEIPKYQEGFPLEKFNYSIEKEDIDESLERLRENAAEAKVLDEPAQSGHHLVADVEELGPDGKVINESKDSKITLGKDPFVGDTEKELIGAKAGDVKTILLKADDKDESDHEFKLTITAVEEHALPELNDEFAQTVDPDVENLAALKTKIKDELESYWNKQSNTKLEEDIADWFIEELKEITLPKTLIEEQAKAIYEDMKKRYPSETEMDEKAIIENYSETAEKSLKWQMVKGKIIKDNKIKAEEADMEAKIEEVLKGVNEELHETYKKYYETPQIKEQLEDDVINSKALDHIKSFAKIKEKKITRKARLKEMGQ